jgi:hypothetical protein
MAKKSSVEQEIGRISLITGEDTYSSPTSQPPTSSRRLKSFIPSLNGELAREKANPLFATGAGGKILSLFEFDFNNANGTVTRHFYAATTTTLYEYTAGVLNAVTLPFPSGSSLNDAPVFRVVNNTLHMADGLNSWIFDGTTWLLEGFPLPFSPVYIVPNAAPASYAIAASPGGLSRSAGIVTMTHPSTHRQDVGDIIVVTGTTATGLVIASVARDDIGNTSTAVTSSAHGLGSGASIDIIGVTDGTFDTAGAIVTVVDSTTFSYTNPGTALATSSGGKVSNSFDGTFIVLTVSYDFLDRLTLTYAQAGINDTDTSGSGSMKLQSFSINTNRYYWKTWADQTDGRIHESTSSAISTASGAIAGQTINVTAYEQGAASFAAASATVTGVGTNFTSKMIGMYIRVHTYTAGTWTSTTPRKIIAVASTTSLTLDAVAGFTSSNTSFTVAPMRATYWHIYCSETENSKIGQYLTSVIIDKPMYTDQSPFLGDPTSLIQPIFRPLRNDPPVGSRLIEVYKDRTFRCRNTRPNFLFFSAGGEVSSGLNGSQYESYPGTDSNTLSDIVNEDSYPVPSNRIRTLLSHGDALYVATEDQCLPWYGEDISDFAFSQVAAFNVGFAGRHAATSNSHGLVFMSYDKKLYLFPNLYAFSYIPKDVEITEQLIELGKPMRTTFEAILSSDIDNVRVLTYQYGRRDWIVVSYQDNTNTYRTWVYDFETKSWFELAVGYTSIEAFEITAGNIILVGGKADGTVHVIDDLTGTYNMAGTYPQAIWRTALQDFGTFGQNHLFEKLDFEISNAAMKADITVNIYFDPADVDNPTSPQKLTLRQVKGTNKYRGQLPSKPATFNRVMVELIITSSTNYGTIRTIKLDSKVITGMMEKT